MKISVGRAFNLEATGTFKRSEDRDGLCERFVIEGA